jgi:thiamine-monophosphate kinase
VKLKDLGEGGLIRRIRERFGPKADELPVGIGDDAAVIDLPAGTSLVFCSDLVAENSHFLGNLHPPDSIAYKAIAANVSDVAAMGGVAMHFLISIAAPPDLEWSWFESFLEGVARACRDFDISFVGGDSSSSDRIFIDVSMIGRVPAGKAVRRAGAKPGDIIYVTGKLGSSALGLERLKAGTTTNDPSIQRHLYPEPRFRIGPALANRVHAMIDVSDGLSTDLTHILDESKVSARIYKDRLPRWPGTQDRHVLDGGEEYELIIVGPADLPGTVDGVPLTSIGEITTAGEKNQILLIDGTEESTLLPKGWQHFE